MMVFLGRVKLSSRTQGFSTRDPIGSAKKKGLMTNDRQKSDHLEMTM